MAGQTPWSLDTNSAGGGKTTRLRTWDDGGPSSRSKKQGMQFAMRATGTKNRGQLLGRIIFGRMCFWSTVQGSQGGVGVGPTHHGTVKETYRHQIQHQLQNFWTTMTSQKLVLHTPLVGVDKTTHQKNWILIFGVLSWKTVPIKQSKHMLN